MGDSNLRSYPGDGYFAVGLLLITGAIPLAAAGLLWIVGLAVVGVFPPSERLDGPVVMIWVAVGMAMGSLPFVAVWWWKGDPSSRRELSPSGER